MKPAIVTQDVIGINTVNFKTTFKVTEDEKFENDYRALVMRFSYPVTDDAPQPEDYLVEECAELIQAIQHFKRARYRKEHANLDNCAEYSDACIKVASCFRDVAKEMAHVITMIDATCTHFKIMDAEIREYKQDLIDRYLNTPNDGRHVESPTNVGG